MLKGFKNFMMRGNVIDLAVAVVIGGAFGGVVTSLVKGLITPLIAALVGKPDFSAISFTVNNSKFLVGDFLNAVVARARSHGAVREEGFHLIDNDHRRGALHCFFENLGDFPARLMNIRASYA